MEDARLIGDAYTCAKTPCYKADEACTTTEFEDIQTLKGTSTAGNVAG